VAAGFGWDYRFQLGLQMTASSTPSVQPIVCPVCGLSAPVVKVSTLYIAGIREKRSADQDALFPDGTPPANLTAQDLHALSRKLAPPSSGKSALTRPLHPDLIVLVFSVVAPFFLAGIVSQQAGLLLPILVLLLLSYGVYFYKRKDAIAKFLQDKQRRQDERARIERGIQVWMKLYYCFQDEGIFLPGQNEMTPVEEMLNYLAEGN
jgi:hypothetical protein